MLTIDEMLLTLPRGFEPRAERIARLIGDHLADVTFPRALSAARLDLPSLAIAADASDAQVAARVAEEIQRAVRSAPALESPSPPRGDR